MFSRDLTACIGHSPSACVNSWENPCYFSFFANKAVFFNSLHDFSKTHHQIHSHSLMAKSIIFYYSKTAHTTTAKCTCVWGIWHIVSHQSWNTNSNNNVPLSIYCSTLHSIQHFKCHKLTWHVTQNPSWSVMLVAFNIFVEYMKCYIFLIQPIWQKMSL